ncbi:DUF397 domain-containing protein [Nocardia kruczakiae]|uniref:DUF397 domain-containing protein n=1 Tax=Nocardia kruczakiae TaxID=261477 RepID=UPI0007A3E3E0|nr:DUF397 domain-containing protein [Nocardia kruczakiae]
MPTPARYRPEVTSWFTSTRTNNGNQCVEVRFDGDAVLIRDSKYRRDPANRPELEPIITVDAPAWMAFLRRVLHGDSEGDLRVRPASDGGTVLVHDTTELSFTPGEWRAFLAGARDGEFDRIPAATAAPG